MTHRTRLVDSKTRVKVKWLFRNLEDSFCLQRKKWYGWKTTASHQVSIAHMFESFEDMLQYFIWLENEKQRRSIIIKKIIRHE